VFVRWPSRFFYGALYFTYGYFFNSKFRGNFCRTQKLRNLKTANFGIVGTIRKKITQKMSLASVPSAIAVEKISIAGKRNIIISSDGPCAAPTGNDQIGVRSSPFSGVYEPVFWYSLTPFQLIMEKHTGKTLEYSIPGDAKSMFHYLAHTAMEIELPHVVVIDGEMATCRIAWSPDLHKVIVPSGHLENGTFSFSHFDLHSNEVYGEYHCVFRDDHTYKRDSGNINSLMKFSRELRTATIVADHPWTYMRSPTTSFPIYRLKNTKLTHMYTDIRLEISKLIRMQKKIGNVWTDVPTDVNMILVDGLSCGRNQQLAEPKVWGMFGNNTECEIRDVNSQTVEYQIRDFVTTEKAWKLEADTDYSIDLPNIAGLVKATYWLAENTDSQLYNIYTNYTVNVDGQACNPFVSYSMTQGDHVKFKDVPAHMFSGVYARHHFDTSPKGEGFNALPRCYKPNDVINDVGVDTKIMKCVLTCKTRKNMEKTQMTLRVVNSLIRTLDLTNEPVIIQ
jgi:hypothetical protein